MKTISENKIKNILKGFEAQPDSAWQDKIAEKLEYLDDSNVTNADGTRNYPSNLFYLFNFSIMNAKSKLITGIAAVVVVLGSLAGIVYASDSAKPGDLLFGLDKAIEELQRKLTASEERIAELEKQILEERKQELAELDTDNDFEDLDEAENEVEEQEDRVDDDEDESEVDDEDENEVEDETEVEDESEDESDDNEDDSSEDSDDSVDDEGED